MLHGVGFTMISIVRRSSWARRLVPDWLGDGDCVDELDRRQSIAWLLLTRVHADLELSCDLKGPRNTASIDVKLYIQTADP